MGGRRAPSGVYEAANAGEGTVTGTRNVAVTSRGTGTCCCWTSTDVQSTGTSRLPAPSTPTRSSVESDVHGGEGDDASVQLAPKLFTRGSAVKVPNVGCVKLLPQ